MKKYLIYAGIFLAIVIPFAANAYQATNPPVAQQANATPEITEAASPIEDLAGTPNEVSLGELGAAIAAVDLLEAWISAGASET